MGNTCLKGSKLDILLLQPYKSNMAVYMAAYIF